MPLTRVLVATTNPHKVRELRQIWRAVPVDLTDLSILPGYRPPEEAGQDYAANAALKASAAARQAGLWAVADDSGLEVEALQGRPGIHSARYGGPGATSADQRRRLLEELDGVDDAHRGAQFVCALVLAAPDGRVAHRVERRVAGRITREERGDGGFGYDPIFFVPWLGATLAEVPAAVKDLVSHRGRAAAALAPALRGLAASPSH